MFFIISWGDNPSDNIVSLVYFTRTPDRNYRHNVENNHDNTNPYGDVIVELVMTYGDAIVELVMK